MPNLVGIGALNVDYIATRKRLLGLEPNLLAEFADRFEYGGERPVDETEINATLSQMGGSQFQLCLGGSAFNVVQTLASMDVGLELGYIGVAGKTGVPQLDFARWFERHDVDSQFVLRASEERAGICISYVQNGERSLLTFPGANVKIADFLLKNHDKIVDYLTQAQVVHVTSFYDNETPDVLSWTLRAAKERQNLMKVSFDPGPQWVRARIPQLQQILSISDLVFLNDGEFKELGHYRPGSQDHDVAKRIFDMCDMRTLQIVLKRYDMIKLFFRIRDHIISRTIKNHVTTPDVIEDSTGAGDVFAAGFLLSTLIPGVDWSHGAELGLELVRSKLLVAGNGESRAYANIFRNFVSKMQVDS